LFFPLPFPLLLFCYLSFSDCHVLLLDCIFHTKQISHDRRQDTHTSWACYTDHIVCVNTRTRVTDNFKGIRVTETGIEWINFPSCGERCSCMNNTGRRESGCDRFLCPFPISYLIEGVFTPHPLLSRSAPRSSTARHVFINVIVISRFPVAIPCFVHPLFHHAGCRISASPSIFGHCGKKTFLFPRLDADEE
jgi:hypothetical protein